MRRGDERRRGGHVGEDDAGAEQRGEDEGDGERHLRFPDNEDGEWIFVVVSVLLFGERR